MTVGLQEYANRRYDYLAFRNVAPQGKRRLEMVLYDEQDSGQIAVGAQKLAQRWVLEFLTEEGSMPGLPKRGSTFMTRARQGKLRTQTDVITAFSNANVFIKRNLRDEEYEGMPDDEKFASADLLSVAILPGYVQLNVMINSVAQSNRSVIIPIDTLP